MKILQLITARQYRGAEIFAEQLSAFLTHEGHEVLIVSLYDAQGSTFTPRVPYEDLHGEKAPLISWKLLRKLNDVSTEFQPDIIQANAGDTLKYAVALRLVFGSTARIVFRNASTISQYTGRGLKSMLIGQLLKRVDKVISVSELSKKDITSLYPFLKSRTIVVPGGIDVNVIRIESSDYQSLFDPSPVFIHVAGFTFEKNHTGLLKLMSIYKSKGGRGRLLLVGDGPLRKTIAEEIERSGFGNTITLLGNRTDVPQLMLRARALLLPSVIEGLPTVILEAFACRIPVIAYDVGGVGELVKNETTGWLIGKNNEEQFVDAMLMVETITMEQKTRVTSSALKLITEKYDHNLIGKQFESIYRTLIEN